MKKLLFMGALGVTGFGSAKNAKVECIANANIITENYFSSDLMISKLLRVYDWVHVTTDCGKVFYLNNNMYGDCYKCLQEDARYFTDAQCGTGYGFDVPF